MVEDQQKKATWMAKIVKISPMSRICIFSSAEIGFGFFRGLGVGTSLGTGAPCFERWSVKIS